MASCVVKFGAASWVASIADSGGSGTEGEGICVKDLTEVEVKMLVEDMVSKKTKGPSFHWVGGCTPFVGCLNIVTNDVSMNASFIVLI